MYVASVMLQASYTEIIQYFIKDEPFSDKQLLIMITIRKREWGVLGCIIRLLGRLWFPGLDKAEVLSE
jgi:hypothetical protein